MEMTTTGILSISSPLNQMEMFEKKSDAKSMLEEAPSIAKGIKRAPWKKTVDDKEEDQKFLVRNGRSPKLSYISIETYA